MIDNCVAVSSVGSYAYAYNISRHSLGSIQNKAEMGSIETPSKICF